MRLKVLAVLSVLMVGFVAGGYLALAKGIPSISDLKKYRASDGTKVYADDDSLVGEFKEEKGTYVTLDRIPQGLRNAVIAVEDSRFWSHKGIDYIGIGRALVTDIMHASLKEGGSTITQQLAKILFLSPEKTLKRKLREAQLAIRLEKELTKNEILELYLNRVYFGHGAYGVEMASKTYFGKSVSKVSLPEAALLAALIKAPNIYSPYNNLVKAKERQEIVLDRMEKEEYLTAAQKAQAQKQPIALSSLRASSDANSYFLEYVRQQLEQTYDIETIYRGGLRVYTTLNSRLQIEAQKALQEGLREVDKRRGWRGPVGHRENIKGENEEPRVAFAASAGELSTGVVLSVSAKEAKIRARGITGALQVGDALWAARVIDSQTGKAQVLKNFKLSDILKRGDVVWVRFRTPSTSKQVLFSLEQEPDVEGAVVALDPENGYLRALIGGFAFTRGEYNRAVSSKRQPGSAFKPVVYAAALEKGYTPATVINDEPVSYPGGPLGEWTPANYDHQFFGPLRLREALAYSRNVVTVKLAEAIGIDTLISFARNVGVESNMPRELTISLGSVSVTPLELASVYAVFANGGTRIAHSAIKYVTDKQGKVLEAHEPEGSEVMSPQAAFLITSMMEDVITYGTGSRARIGRPAAGKTGTSSDYKDAWFVGYTPQLVGCVWVGFDDMRRSLGQGEVGGRAAAPIWSRFMTRALADEPPAEFPQPEGILRLSIDPATGLLVSDPSAGIKEYFSPGTQPKEYVKTQKRLERPAQLGDFD
jgi:penicillin-binding protein 1A